MGHHMPIETNVTTRMPRCAEIAHHVLGLGPTKGLFGMALELNSSSSKQFSCQTGQLQNSMELQNSGAVVHFLLEFWSTSFAAPETSIMDIDMELD